LVKYSRGYLPVARPTVTLSPELLESTRERANGFRIQFEVQGMAQVTMTSSSPASDFLFPVRDGDDARRCAARRKRVAGDKLVRRYRPRGPRGEKKNQEQPPREAEDTPIRLNLTALTESSEPRNVRPTGKEPKHRKKKEERRGRRERARRTHSGMAPSPQPRPSRDETTAVLAIHHVRPPTILTREPPASKKKAVGAAKAGIGSSENSCQRSWRDLDAFAAAKLIQEESELPPRHE